MFGLVWARGSYSGWLAGTESCFFNPTLLHTTHTHTNTPRSEQINIGISLIRGGTCSEVRTPKGAFHWSVPNSRLQTEKGQTVSPKPITGHLAGSELFLWTAVPAPDSCWIPSLGHTIPRRLKIGIPRETRKRTRAWRRPNKRGWAWGV